jgi:hypothetical protein
MPSASTRDFRLPTGLLAISGKRFKLIAIKQSTRAQLATLRNAFFATEIAFLPPRMQFGQTELR